MAAVPRNAMHIYYYSLSTEVIFKSIEVKHAS